MRLKELDGRKLGELRLKLEARQLAFIEQQHFSLFLVDGKGNVSRQPVIDAIHSSGVKHLDIKGWIDGEYREVVELGGRKAELSKEGLDAELFQLLGRIAPAGGSMMVAYDMLSGESEVHRKTREMLSLGFPEIITPIGFLLFKAGCLSFRDWYIAEGGSEGSRKLQGFKPLSSEVKEKRREERVGELELFLERIKKKEKEADEKTLEFAKIALKELKLV